ncbi:MAG: hypothetical protein JWQ81_6472 [Amycolatopsis sp.]|jgi:hypothetical protein|uniref:DF family (seleno)protein n=1 Tax=Amycolatopsis sp. TaxID=37632 RepID=UPI002619DC9D|nr:hypothetical protein [Amycolatopsis sp.]MCU1685733.1 hypothetical protein [Amycolatopsis sp.]
MEVRLLVVPDCPNETPAANLARHALDELGLTTTPVVTVVVTSQEQAEELGFAGSPTITIDGVDPFAQPGQIPALACRVYRTDTGITGTPDPALLRHALRRARPDMPADGPA